MYIRRDVEGHRNPIVVLHGDVGEHVRPDPRMPS